MEYDGALTSILVKNMTKENVYNYQYLEISDSNTCGPFLLGGEFYWITIGTEYVVVNQVHDKLNTYDTVSSDLTSTQISTIFSIQLVT